MVQTRSMRNKAATKASAKQQAAKKKAPKKGKKAVSKRITKKKPKKTRMKRTYKNTKQKKAEMLFKVLKNYKNQGMVNIDEMLLSQSDEDEWDQEGVDYQEMAEDLLEHYQNKTFDLSQFVFEKQIFESLSRKMRIGS